MSEWQPMENAPRDGTTILIKLSTGREVQAECWIPPDGWAVDAFGSWQDDTFEEDDDADFVGWRPLSEHPAFEDIPR